LREREGESFTQVIRLIKARELSLSSLNRYLLHTSLVDLFKRYYEKVY